MWVFSYPRVRHEQRSLAENTRQERIRKGSNPTDNAPVASISLLEETKAILGQETCRTPCNDGLQLFQTAACFFCLCVSCKSVPNRGPTPSTARIRESTGVNRRIGLLLLFSRRSSVISPWPGWLLLGHLSASGSRLTPLGSASEVWAGLRVWMASPGHLWRKAGLRAQSRPHRRGEKWGGSNWLPEPRIG